MLARFFLTLACLLVTLAPRPACAQDSGSDAEKDSETGSALVLGSPSGDSAEASSSSDPVAEKAKDAVKPRSLLDESSKKLVEPKRLSVKSVSGSAVEKLSSEDSTATPVKPTSKEKDKAPTLAKPKDQTANTPAQPKASNPTPAKRPATTTSTDTQPTVAESKATLRPIEPKKLIEKASPDGGETFLMR